MRSLLLLATCVAGTGCATVHRPPTMQTSAVGVSAASLAGTWRMIHGDGLALRIDLKADGTYDAEWIGCIDIMASSSGRWSRQVHELTFEAPPGNRVVFGEELRSATLRTHRGQLLLVLPEYEDDIARGGPKSENVLAREALRKPWRRR